MVKQTKTFKKGNVTKKALSAILAASMVMTSSSFVMAAPVEVEDVAVEAAAVDVVEDVDAGEESVGGVLTAANVTVEDVTYRPTGYTEAQIAEKVVVTDETGAELEYGADYTVAIKGTSDPVTNAGDYTVQITFVDTNYTESGVLEKTFKIKPYELSASNVSVTYNEKATGYRYTGEVQKPSATITITKGDLRGQNVAASEYEVVAYDSSYDLKSAGTQKVKVALKDATVNYTLAGNLLDYTYTIDKGTDVSDVVATAESMAYTGSVVTPNVVVKKGTDVLDPSTYDVVIKKDNKEVEPKDMGTYDIVVTTNGTGNYVAGKKITGTFVIAPASLEIAAREATIKGTTKTEETHSYNGQNYPVYETVYNGKEQAFAVEDITIPGLTLGEDYELDGAIINPVIENTPAAGGMRCIIKLKGKNKYAGNTIGFSIRVAPKELNTTDYTIVAKASKDAVANQVIVSVKDGDKELEQGANKDYTFTADTTKKTVTINGKGNYTTQKKGDAADKGITVSYTESQKILIDDTSKVGISVASSVEWNGKQLTPAVTVVDKANQNTPLVKGTDYTVAYGENVNTGLEAGTVTITGIGRYEGTVVKTFEITGTPISAYSLELNNVTLEEAKAGKGQVTPSRLVTSAGNTAPLGITYGDLKYFAGAKDITSPEAFAEYVATLKEDTLGDGVTITVKAIGTGKYSGEVQGTYKIIKSDKEFTVGDIADQTYTGEAIEPSVVVKKGVAVLVKGTDYTVSYDNNVKVGTAYAIVKGIGKYAGTKTVAFNIVGEMDQTIEVLAAQERDLGNGTRTLNSKATKIKFATAPETAVTYTSSDENVVTVDAEGNVKYTGLGEATITIEAKAENGYKAAKKEVKVVVTLAKPSFTPFSKNNAFTLTSSTVKGAEKFEVQYATKKDFSNKKSVKFTATSGKVRQVKVSAGDKKTYYVRVRAISGTETSAWSTVKTVATK